MYSTFSSFKENTFIEHVKINLKVGFQKAILNQMKFIWYQIWSCLTIVQSHAHECLVHWNGLLGDVRALIPGVQDQGGLVRGIHVQDGICCGHPINIWRMVWLWTQRPVSSNESHKCFSFDKQFYQTDWSDKQLCWKTKALSKILIKYIQISKQYILVSSYKKYHFGTQISDHIKQKTNKTSNLFYQTNTCSNESSK